MYTPYKQINVGSSIKKLYASFSSQQQQARTHQPTYQQAHEHTQCSTTGSRQARSTSSTTSNMNVTEGIALLATGGGRGNSRRRAATHATLGDNEGVTIQQRDESRRLAMKSRRMKVFFGSSHKWSI